ncbi:MAG: DNA polymerase III subunit delta [Planctomycetaceae bacterium]
MADGPLSVLDYLESPEKHAPASVTVLFGDEPFLKGLALEHLCPMGVGDKDDLPTIYDVEEKLPEWRDVIDELSSQSLFGGGGARLVVLRHADPFVSAQRARLEDYVAKPRKSGRLLLDVTEWGSNTRLYKSVAEHGLQIECRAPMRVQGKSSKVLDDAKVATWVMDRGKKVHHIAVERAAAALLVELSGAVFGMLDQDLAKLALYVTRGQKVTPELVQEVVGGWRAKTTWEMIDAVLDGNPSEALLQLDRFLQSGEHPLALFGSISWSLRRYAAATRYYEQSVRRKQPMDLRSALLKGGVRQYPADELAKGETRLKALGRVRATELYKDLIEIDVALKGSHSDENRARWLLENLFLKISRPLAAKPAR